MIHLIVPLLLAVLTFAPSLQDGRKSDGQSNKPNTTRHDAQRKKKVPPPATPESSQSKVNEPSFHYNQTNTEEPAKPVHNWVDFLNAISTAVVGAFTIVLAVVAYRQNLATRTAERAWIVAIPPEPPTRNPAGDYEIRWELENKGRTPAWVTALGSA